MDELWHYYELLQKDNVKITALYENPKVHCIYSAIRPGPKVIQLFSCST